MTRQRQAVQVEQFGQPLVQKELDIPTPGAVNITLLIKENDAAKRAYLGKMRITFFGSMPPVSTLIPVAMLYAPNVLFEMDAAAVARR
jgi:hypothetical protein